MASGAAATTDLLRQIGVGLLDLVYPPRCFVCETLDRPAVCDVCAASFTPIPTPACETCGRPIDDENAACRHCAEQVALGGWAFEVARAGAIYVGPLRHAIHRLKYNHIEPLGEPLGAFLANRLVADGLLGEARLDAVDMVAALPIHARKERTRGFNQARLLALPVAEMRGVPLLPPHALVRARASKPQVGLSGDARRRSVAPDAFAVPDPGLVAGKTILLIDDVFTTGATVNACAGALRDAGARAVFVGALAAGG